MILPYVLIAAVFAAFGIAALTARTASERGRRGVRWMIASVIAWIVGQLGGFLAFGRIWNTDPTSSLSFAVTLVGGFAVLLGPLACMLAVLALLVRLPERIPKVRATRWRVYQMSSKDSPGFECVLSVEKTRICLGDQLVIEAQDLTDIAADGECLRLSWSGKSVLLMPRDKEWTPSERAKQSLGIREQLRELLEWSSRPSPNV
jgi:hypothetical protein